MFHSLTFHQLKSASDRLTCSDKNGSTDSLKRFMNHVSVSDKQVPQTHALTSVCWKMCESVLELGSVRNTAMATTHSRTTDNFNSDISEVIVSWDPEGGCFNLSTSRRVCIMWRNTRSFTSSSFTCLVHVMDWWPAMSKESWIFEE